jgi:hypothetical protein
MVNDGLAAEDVRFVVQHELNEIADIVHRRPNATAADIQAETAASLFRPGSTAATATAHDRAAARELAMLDEELANRRAAHKPDQVEISNQQARLDRMLRAMGLDQPSAITEAQRAELRAAGVSEELVRDIERGGATLRVTENYRRTISDYSEAQPMLSTSQEHPITAPGHSRSKHGAAKQVVLSFLNAPERIFTGTYGPSGRRVDVYVRGRSWVITEAGQKDVVITAYGPEINPRDRPVNLDNLEGYSEIPLR